MIFVDTNILLDVFENAPTEAAAWSRRVLEQVAATETLVTNLVVAAELSGLAENADELDTTLSDADIDLVELDFATAFRAGEAHREYRRRGGAKASILADFLIAGHAETLGAQLMTRDRRLGGYFPDLALISPETHP